MKLAILAVLSCCLLGTFSGTNGQNKESETDLSTNFDSSKPEIADQPNSGQPDLANPSDGADHSGPSASTIDLDNTESNTIKAGTLEETVRILARSYKNTPIIIITSPATTQTQPQYPIYPFYPYPQNAQRQSGNDSGNNINIVNNNTNTQTTSFVMMAG